MTKPKTNGHANGNGHKTTKRAAQRSKEDRMEITAKTMSWTIAGVMKRYGVSQPTVSMWRREYRDSVNAELDNIPVDVRAEPAQPAVGDVPQLMEALYAATYKVAYADAQKSLLGAIQSLSVKP